VNHVHELVSIAYLRVDTASLSSAEEPDITGRLVAAIKDVLNARSGPSWRSHYCVRDDPPVGRAGGRSRPRVDIEFERTSPLPRPQFQFEAKRLHSPSCVGRYLGSEGLQRFITKRYATNDEDAGMLGYVQNSDSQAWGLRLQQRMRSSMSQYQMRTIATPWPTQSIVANRGVRFHSVHARKTGADIAISHTLLRFY
jgi:hypothetical protein